MKKVSILDLYEDLLEDDRVNHTPQTPKIKRKVGTGNYHSSTGPTPMETFTAEVARILEIDTQELNNWDTDINAPMEVLKNILLTAKRLKLNPIMGHIGWELNAQNQWEIYIPIDGWIAMIHREPSFKGMTFNQSFETEEGIPIWMECSIYRADLTHPITVREYYAELKTEHPIWQQKPRRMLRHKILQQCARLAFGISVPELKIPITPPIIEKPSMVHATQSAPNRKALLRQKLL